MSVRILRLKEVQQKTGKSKSGIYEAMAEGDFPSTVSLGARAVGWLEHELDKWISDKVAQRDEVVR